VPRECRQQLPLIDLLCDHEADPDTASEASALHGELEALEALLGRGARLNLPIATALARIQDFRRLLPAADSRDRHLALALASQLDRVEIARLLLEGGEDPDRYNPVGGHSHSTPLHQAAAYGSMEMVRLLVERGARLDQRDILWHGTPAGWAEHEGKTEIAEYLRAQEAARSKKEE
jgi:ankyrin repeat protein